MELIHTCYRITDPDRSVTFYEALGFEKRRELPIRDEAINIFMGLPGDGDRLQLTYSFGVDSYELEQLQVSGRPARQHESALAAVGDPGRVPDRALTLVASRTAFADPGDEASGL